MMMTMMMTTTMMTTTAIVKNNGYHQAINKLHHLMTNMTRCRWGVASEELPQSLCPGTASEKSSTRSLLIVTVTVIVNSRLFLQRPQKQSCRNQLIHWRLSKMKSIGKRLRSRESNRHRVRRLWWMVFTVETEEWSIWTGSKAVVPNLRAGQKWPSTPQKI